MNNSIEKLAYEWIEGDILDINLKSEYYCRTRDTFQSRLDKMIVYLLNQTEDKEKVYLLAASAGEIGNNSFDHNLGSWPDAQGVFFAFNAGREVSIVLADRGSGILKTLKRVKPGLKSDKEALFTAFHEKISGRAPEARGNGLKFVKDAVKQIGAHLTFISGGARADLNKEVKIQENKKRLRGCLAVMSLSL